MEKQIIHITAFDEPLRTRARPKSAWIHSGQSCRCGEFVAFSTREPRQVPVNIEFAAALPILAKCLSCQCEELQEAQIIMRVRLTEQNRQALHRNAQRATSIQNNL